MENLEKMITVRIMQEDAETIFSLMKTERDPIFVMEIIPYYQEVISIENIQKPFYGIVETCYNGMGYYSFLDRLRRLADKMIDLLEKHFNIEKITLQRL